MRKIIVGSFLTLDGVMQAPGGPEGSDLEVHGSGTLAQILLQHDFVDELWLLFHPLALGAGKKLFGDGTIPVSTATPGGVMAGHYKRAGDVKTGMMGA